MITIMLMPPPREVTPAMIAVRARHPHRVNRQLPCAVKYSLPELNSILASQVRQNAKCSVQCFLNLIHATNNDILICGERTEAHFVRGRTVQE